VADEDYDKASEIKGEVDSLRAEIEEKVSYTASIILPVTFVCTGERGR
jgi:hypothetical protein